MKQNVTRMVAKFGMLGGLCLGSACDSAVQPSAESILTPSAPFIVSNPTGGSSGTAGSTAPGASVVYVSLPPGAIPGAEQADVHVVGSAQFIAVPMVDGGFDPVGVAATEGDTIQVVARADATTPPTIRLFRVPPAKPPIIVRTEPPPNKRDVPLNANLVVVFSEPVSASVLVDESVMLWVGGTPVGVTRAFADAAHTRLQITIPAGLALGTDYDLVIGTSVRDLDGSPLEVASSVPFATVTVVQSVLTVVRTEPVSQRTNVPILNPRIEVWFSEPVSWNSYFFGPSSMPRLQLWLGNTLVNSDGTGSGCRTGSSGGGSPCSSILLILKTPLVAGATYDLVIKAGLTGASGAVLPADVTTRFTTENPPPGASAAVLSALSFTMIEFQYPSAPGRWFYAPQVRLAETAGISPAMLSSLSFTIPGFGGRSPLVCASLSIPAGASMDLFSELYGDFELTFDKPGARASAGDATAVVTFRDNAGRIDSLEIHGPIVPGQLPTTYTGGTGHGYYGAYPSCERSSPSASAGALHLRQQ